MLCKIAGVTEWLEVLQSTIKLICSRTKLSYLPWGKQLPFVHQHVTWQNNIDYSRWYRKCRPMTKIKTTKGHLLSTTGIPEEIIHWLYSLNIKCNNIIVSCTLCKEQMFSALVLEQLLHSISSLHYLWCQENFQPEMIQFINWRALLLIISISYFLLVLH